MGDCFEIESEDLRFYLSPQGATIAGLKLRTSDGWVDLLRFAPALTSFIEGSWLMAPYAGRVAGLRGEPGVLRFLGSSWPLGSGQYRERDYAIHGPCCRFPWQVMECSNHVVEMQFCAGEHPDVTPGLFPFLFSVRTRYSVNGRRLSCEASISNMDFRPMPAALGWHPFWERHLPGASGEIEARFCAAGVYPKHNDMLLPDGAFEAIPPELDFARFRAVPYELDHGFIDVTGPLQLRWPGSNVEVTIDSSPEFSHVVIYSPQGGLFDDRLAFEWQTAASNAATLHALNISKNGLRILEPEESLSVKWVLEAGAAHLSVR